jgi:hypothetical protein
VFPQANPRVLAEVDRADAIIFGIGSLYTSICPTLCLDGVGEHIASRDVPKVGVWAAVCARVVRCSCVCSRGALQLCVKCVMLLMWALAAAV